MKLVSLNTWGGRVGKPFFDFIERYKEVDIFCFQEIYHEAEGKGEKQFQVANLNLYSELVSKLPGHQSFFRPQLGDHYGLAIFIKKDIEVKEEGDVLIFEPKNYTGGGNHSRNLQYVTFSKNNEEYLVANVHGLWNGQGKGDTEDRLVQSEKIKQFLDSKNAKKILCGDFNLNPDTESLARARGDLRDLIREYEITSTRTSLYDKSEKFADYVFVSSDIEVNDFKVLPDEVSDHAALLLEF